MASGDTEAQFMCAIVGPHLLAFDLRTLLSIEGRARVEHEAILGPVNLRDWLGIPRDEETPEESLLILGDGSVTRFIVDQVVRLERSDLPKVHSTPALLRPLLGPLCLPGVVELRDGLAFLVDPKSICEAAATGEAA